MAPIDEAIAAYESQDPNEQLSLRALSKKFGVPRSTLSRRVQGLTRSRAAKHIDQQLLSPQQELELCSYIEDLTKHGLPPTRSMIQNFASGIAKTRASEAWVTRFLHRNSAHLISKWTTGMDAVRHQADSKHKYELYFDLLHGKMEEYRVLPGNTYNMDEKGFLIGVIGRLKRVFSRRQWEQKEVTAALQDGSREWITLIAAISAEGEVLPPGLLYASTNSTLQSTWTAGIEAGKHDVFVTSTPTGWSNNDVGIAWLEQVFNRCTEEKARSGRAYRLLILDGHGSHVTKEFIDYCDDHRILLAVFPPHSTHTVQPLDVVMFKPLSSYYSNALTTYTQRSQGLVPIRKGDFFPLFWEAWRNSFTKENALKAFEATGIWPMERVVILKRFDDKPQDEAQTGPSALTDADWRQMDRLVRTAVQDNSTDEAKQLSQTLHHLQVQNELLHLENDGLKDAVSAKKRHKKKGKTLNLQQRQEYHGGSVFWSPRKLREARYRETIEQRDEEQLRFQKATDKELKQAATLYKKKIAEEKRVAREAAKVLKEKERAEKAAERARKNEANNTRKVIQKSQLGKRKASLLPSSKPKRQRRSGGATVVASSSEAALAAPPKLNSRGRPIRLPRKYN